MQIQKDKIIKITFLLYIASIFTITQLPINFVINLNFLRINYNLIPFYFLSNAINKLKIIEQNGYDIKFYTIPILLEIVKSFGFNIILFFPMGFFLPILYKKYQNIKNIIFICFAWSLCIETIQLITMSVTSTSNRCFDVDDIIANTFGGIIGFYFYAVATRFYKNRVSQFIQSSVPSKK